MRRFCLIFLFAVFSVVVLQTPQLCRAATVEANYVPWSGYWWPFRSGGLVTGSDYRGKPSPLEKYDYVTSGTRYGPAWAYGMEYYYNFNALSWEGMCFCWAAASILEEEPVHKGVYEGSLFFVGDKKGLLTAAYDGALFRGYLVDNPEEFLRVLGEFIGKQKTPVIFDLGTTGGEIWNYPVFKYDITEVHEGTKTHYTTTIYYISDDVPPDYVGSSVCTSIYYFYFVTDGEGNITESGWEGDSVGYHPKYAYEPYGTRCRNTGMDYDEVIKIVNRDDDAYEENDSRATAAAVSTGSYTLLAADDDWFKVSLRIGDKLSVLVKAENEEDISVNIYDPEENLIQEMSGIGNVTLNAEKTGSYFLEIIPLNRSEEAPYELSLLLGLSYQGIFPVDPSGLWFNGIALLSKDGPMGRTIISQVNRDGDIEATYNAALSSRRALGLLKEDFGLCRPDNGYVRVDCDSPLRGLECANCPDYQLMYGANLIRIDKATGEVFFPHLARTNGWKTSLGLINTGDETEEILRESYDDDGAVYASDTIVLPPWGKSEIDIRDIGVLNSGTKTMRAAAVSGRKCLIGYIKYLNPSFGSKGRALVPMDAEGYSELVVPHIASDSNWWTGIAIMNTGFGDSPVTFSAYDSEGSLLAVSEHNLRQKQNFVKEASGIFPGVQGNKIAFIRISSNNNDPFVTVSLCGLLLYGSRDGLELAGMPIRPAAESSLFIPHIAGTDLWWTGIGVVNAGEVQADIHLSLFNADGDLLDAVTRQLNPNQRLAATMKRLFGPENAGDGCFLEIESSEACPLSGIYLMSTNDGSRMMGDAAVP